MAPSRYAVMTRRPKTSIYNDNYLFGFNFYEDMMTWLKKREQGVTEPVPRLPSVPETAFRKFAKPQRPGAFQQECDDAARRTHDRIESLVWRKERAPRRARSFGAFSSKAITDIEEDMRTEARASQDDMLLGRRRRKIPFSYDREGQLSEIMERRLRLDEEDQELNERLRAAGLKFSSQLERAQEALAGYSREESSYQTTTSRESKKDVQVHFEDYCSASPDLSISAPLLSSQLIECPTSWELKCKQMTIEIEQLNSRLVEAESRLKIEVNRIKKKYQVQITELEMSLDVANRNNIELQKTIKKQALQITDLQSHYDEIQRQLQSTIDQYGIAQRRCQALQAELDEMRGNLEAAMRAKRQAEQQYEEVHTRINELTTININISASKSKLEAEYSALQADFDEIHKELKLADERSNKSSAELKHTVDILHEEQERIIKIESIRKSLDVEVRTLTVRLEEVEANALVGGKRVISKLEARIRDVEMEFDEEKRRHQETIKMLRKKERHVKELLIQSEESQKTVTLLTDQVEKLNEKIKMYKRQLGEQEGLSSSNLHRVRRFQRELEAAEDRAEHAESNLSFIRAKHRSWVTSSQMPSATKQVYVVEEHRHENF